ncbi:hypothetical protein M885DRAFT_562640 [Pelagophyceae sp. CCMP2097]|nr:hypothetical protein M885DRAFT_562640 [Pelagophyceae sp. CCMP2097]
MDSRSSEARLAALLGDSDDDDEPEPARVAATKSPVPAISSAALLGDDDDDEPEPARSAAPKSPVLEGPDEEPHRLSALLRTHASDDAPAAPSAAAPRPSEPKPSSDAKKVPAGGEAPRPPRAAAAETPPPPPPPRAAPRATAAAAGTTAAPPPPKAQPAKPQPAKPQPLKPHAAGARGGPAASVLDRINHRLSMVDADEDDELAFKGAEEAPGAACALDAAPSKDDAVVGDGVVRALTLACAHDVACAPSIVIDCVWENQSRDAVASISHTVLRRGEQAQSQWKATAPSSRLFRRRPAFECEAQPELAVLFSQCGGPPVAVDADVDDGAGLPTLAWRWISPWQLDSAVHGADRTTEDALASPADWLYGAASSSAWPVGDVGYRVAEANARLRCRRWVRPRERVRASELTEKLCAKYGGSLTARALGDALEGQDGDVINLDAAIARLEAWHDAELDDGRHNQSVVLDFIWENQRWRPPMAGPGAWTSSALVRKQPFESASRAELAALFRKHAGPPSPSAELIPTESGLPMLGDTRQTEWRWLGPWVIDSTSSSPNLFGADRVVVDDDVRNAAQDDGWLYAFDWPRDDKGYTQNPERAFVRCRRWVRPREKAPSADAPPPRPPASRAPTAALRLFS